MIRRRHVIYVEGYDPQGAEGYYAMFRGGCKRFRAVWPTQLDVSPLELESDDFARWTMAAHAPNWDVATQYEFLRQERFIRADMAEPMWRHIPRALAWMADDIFSGALYRILRASWRFGLALLYFECVLLLLLTPPIALGAVVGVLAVRLAHWPLWAGAAVALAVALGLAIALRPLVDHLGGVQITNHWPRLRRYARGEATWFDHSIEAGAQRLVAAARANLCDELVVIGHSGGGHMAPAVVARALELDPGLGGHGPRLVLLTLGSIMPAVALHPSAVRMRAVIARLAVEPSLTWIDCQSRKDVLNFWDFDPVAGIGVEVGAARHNPRVWTVQFKDMMSPDYYRRLRRSFFRLHYQFIMAGDRRAAYDYLMLVAGPLPVADWAEHPDRLKDFAEDATLASNRETAAAAHH